MRKYTMPKFMYILLVSILISLSIGYTYAYFSANTTATGNFEIGSIDIRWKDSNKNADISSLFADSNSIAISGELKRGEYTQIMAKGKDSKDTSVKLQLSNANGTVPAYCRMKVTAKYTPKNSSTELDCGADWIQFALDVDGEKVLITDLQNIGYRGWVYQNGYYYFGSMQQGKLSLSELDAGGGQVVADYMYLSSNADSKVLGSAMKIVLTIEGVQSANDAYKVVWGL